MQVNNNDWQDIPYAKRGVNFPGKWAF